MAPKPLEPSMEALQILRSTDQTAWLSSSDSISNSALVASQYVFSMINPRVPKSPIDRLLIEGFDTEQIWQQIDLQSQPLLSTLRRKANYFEKNPEAVKDNALEEKEVRHGGGEVNTDDENEHEMDVDGFDDQEEDDEKEEDEEMGNQVEEEGVSSDEGTETGEVVVGKGGGIEDKFLRLNELENYLEQDEAREYGLSDENKKRMEKKSKVLHDDDEEEEVNEDEEVEDDEDVDDEIDDFDGDEKHVEGKMARYEDFFGGKNKTASDRKSKKYGLSRQESYSDDEGDDQKKGGLSTHEKHLQKIQSEIEQLERANLEPKTWTMRGEVTATNRPKNSALDVVLDFEHNVRPAPVITEEVTASLEDIIKNRIIEGRFDDVEKAPSLPSKAPRELKELDENKSKKGLAEVYEDEYVQNTNAAAVPLSMSDEQKKEASILFKKLCLKLDALSHFHFAPKPVVEDMSIQANVPALAMEEIAPVAVSDAAMLAPEEIFSGKGDVREEVELSQADRKRRRANKKRKFKAEAAKKLTKKPRDSAISNENEGKVE